jgi:hypothetical protein
MKTLIESRGSRKRWWMSDIFLGWFRGKGGRYFYWRQLKDMKGSANVEGMSPDELVIYAGLCGWALGRAHARSGDRVQIAAYLGKSERFDGAVADFVEAYADRPNRTMRPFARPSSRAGFQAMQVSEKSG